MNPDGLPERLQARLARGRAAAEALMTLNLSAHSPDGVDQDADDYDVPAFVNEGVTRGKVQAGSSAGKDTSTRYVRLGEVERPVLAGGLHIPLSAPVPTAGEQRGIGWEYQVTAVGPSDDPALLGKRFLVVEVPSKSFATARRLDVIEL